MAKPSSGAGTVAIKLDYEEVVLRPTLKPPQTTSLQNGGIMIAVERVTRFDLEAITSVVALVLGREAKDVADAVWRTGCSTRAPHVIKYLGMLANGGRPADGGEGEDDPLNG